MRETLSPNTTLSHYHILAPLGAGGMGEVWLAEDTRLKRKVALKLLPAELTADVERVRRFEQEAQAASALNHPNIITVYDIGECEAGRFIVMELVAGRALRAVIAEDTSTETLLTLGAQMAKALSAAHAAGITHRDIKPDNIMVREDGYVKVLDFGLARLRPATENDSEAATLAQQTTPGTVMGTVAYMSPEQASGQSVSHASDIFALGIVLYELATGRHPFKADTLVGYLHAITLQTPAPPQQWQPNLPAALNDLLLRMLAKEASQRPTANEVAQALQAIERGGDAATRRRSDAGIENETMMLPSAGSGAAPADEGFWVAVLPFKWRGANAELEALAEGLSEDIVTGLSRFSYLRVIARSSTLRYASDSGDVRAIGKELGARYVMEGGLRRAGTKLRLAVQLIDATTGANLWAENYERTFSPEAIFELQDDLVPRIVSTVADQYGALVHSMSESLRGRNADEYSAHEAVLRAFSYLGHITSAEHGEVREILESAVAASPGHGDCRAMLANLYADEYMYGYNRRPDPLGRAQAAAQRAVAAAPTSHIAHYVLATVLFFQKDFPAFRPVAERALALNRMDASTGAMLGVLIAYAGEWEHGLSVVERAIQLNPHHPGWYHLPAFYDCYRRRDYSGALANALKINMPGWYWPQVALAVVYGQLGEQGRAQAALRALNTMNPDFGALAREEFSKWFDAELTEHLLDGLRKAGLEELQTPETARYGTGSGSDLAPLDVRDSEEPGRYRSLYRTDASTSIAVLPFANISADEENEYFCDGLAEELLNALAKIDELKVAARTSAFSFKGKNAEAREIGKTLNVKTVLEGSVRKSGHRIRITVQLVNAADGYHLWSERYDREMKDIFDVQDEITLAVVDALKLKLLGAKKTAVLKRYTDNTEAYELYLKGLYHSKKDTVDGWFKAIEYYEQSIAIAPDYALAYAGISYVYSRFVIFGIQSPRQFIARWKEVSNRALALDDALAEGHASLAAMRFYYDRDWASAEREYRRAIELNSNDAAARHNFGLFLAASQRFDEGVSAGQRALELDPLSLLAMLHLGWTTFLANRMDDVRELAQRMLELDVNFHGAYWLQGGALTAEGKYEEAIAAFQKSLALGGTQVTLSMLGGAYGLAGKRSEAFALLDQLCEERERSYASAFNIARIYAGLGERDQTFAWLEKAIEERNGEIVFLDRHTRVGNGKVWGEIHHDLRYQHLLRRIGLPTTETNQPNEAQTLMLTPSTDGKQAGETFAVPATLRHTVGRERERNELRAAFNAASNGRGSLLCVAGEPGIGKTTLVEDFLAELAADNPCAMARGRCSERLAGTEAYLPLLEALESLLVRSPAFRRNESGDHDIPPEGGTTNDLLKQLAPTWYAQVVPLTGESEESARLLAEVKAASQERMKRELASFLQAVAQAQPLVIFFDDLHWADVSTIDLLSFLAGKFDAMRVLIVVTYRPSDMLLAKHPFLQIKPDLQARGVCRELLLEFLTEAEIAEYLALEFPGHRFPAEFPQLIHAKTEGSPLFMADLVRYLRDRRVIAEEESTRGACVPSWTLAQALPDIERELPESVRGMIERKIAQLSEEDRKLLTAASVQGYEFDSAVVAQVLNLEADEVEERLEKLERVFAFVKLVSESEFPNRTLTLKYRFIHVLYQNALYNALRITRKATLSREVAQTLEDFYGAKKAEIASELANLFEAGREFSQAADYFLMAAQHANQLFAAQEAAVLARRGIDTLNPLPETSERLQQELSLQLSLGLSLRTVKGFGAEETSRAYARARELCHKIGDSPQLFPVLFGLWESYQNQAQFETGMELAQQMLHAAGEDPALLVIAHNVMGDNLTWLGDFVAARAHIEKGIALYDFEQHHANAALYGYDSGIGCFCFGAIVLWHLGYPDQARTMSDKACEQATQLSHPPSTAFAASFAAWFHRLNGSLQTAQDYAEKTITASVKYDMTIFLAFGKIALGWAYIGQGKIEEGVTFAREGGELWRAAGALLGAVWNMGILAEGYAKAGRTAEALSLLNEALELAAQTNERFYEAELLRLKGELLPKSEASHPPSEAEHYFQQAIEIASRQSAKSFELRAVMSLARLWQRQGKLAEARQMLAGIYGWFTEGFDTADLKEAKALLGELS